MGRRVTAVSLEAHVSGYVRPVQNARRETNELRRDAERFAKGRYKADVGVDTAKGKAELSALEKQLQAYARDDASKRVNLDTDEARNRLKEIQTRLAAFGKQVTDAKVDVDDEEARAKLARIEAALLAVGARTAKPDIDLAGVAKAEADLGMLQARLSSFDGNTYRADLRIDGSARASRQMSALIDFGFMLGPAFIAGGGAASGALVAVAGSATMAVGAVGPLALAFSGVGDALKAVDDLQTNAAENAREHARAQVLASRQITDARRGVADAERDAAYANVQAAQQVTDAEEDLADAHRDVDAALEDLHEARQQAIRDLQDLREEESDNALTVEASKIRLIEARQELARTRTDENATALDIRKARLSVKEAEDGLSDARRDAKRDADDLRQAERDGIRNSDQVVQARENVQSAQDRVRSSTEALTNAQVEAARTQLEGSRQVADAERTLRRAVQDANYELSRQTTEAQNLTEAMAELSPAGRDFVRFLADLEPKLEKLQRIAQTGMFLGMQQGITSLMTEMPRFEDIVRSYSRALGQLAEEGGDALTDPFWRDYFDFIGDEARGSLLRMGRATGNIIEGLAGVHQAFFPLQKDIESGVLGWSRSFSKWGRELKHSERFEDFLDYVERVGPKALDAVGAIADALIAVAEAAAPIGEVTLPVIEAFARVVERIARSDIGPPLIAMAVGLAAVNRTLRTFEAIGASNLGAAIGSIGRDSRTASGRLGLLKSAARGAAGVAGLGMLLHSTQQTNEEMATFESVVGSIVTGAAIGSRGGLLGAGIGAAAGAVFGLATAFADSGEAAGAALPSIESYIDTLDELTGASTKATRAEVARRLEEEGILEIAQKAGIPLGQLVTAVLKGGDAYGRLQAKFFAAAQANKISTEEMLKAEKAVEAHSKQVDRDREKQERLTEATRGSAKTLGQLSDRIVANDDKSKKLADTLASLEMRNQRVTGSSELSEKQLRRVANQMGLTREQTDRLIEKYEDVPPTTYTKADFDDKNARDKVRSWNAFIQDQWKKLDKITVSAGFFGEDTLHVSHGGGHGQAAAGGYIDGPGTKTSDSIPMRLSKGEFVQRAAAVDREGVGAMAALNAGRATIVPRAAIGMRDGGLVGSPTVRVDADFSELRTQVREFVKAMRSMSLGAWGPGSGRRVQYSGVTLDMYTLQRLKAAERLIGQRFDLTQGSFSTSVAASGGTHAGGGAFDADSPFTRAAVVALRKAGIAAWRRYPSQGPWGTHIHGIALGDRLASPEAKQQMGAYRAGGDGLGGIDYEPRPGIDYSLFAGSFGAKMQGRSPASAKAYAKHLLSTYGWGAGQWRPLNQLWERESGWRWNADNPTSSAYGIPQSLPGSKMASAGADWRTNPATQITWGLRYIKDRYGTPSRAWGHSEAVGWYDRGGSFPNNSVGVNTSGGTEEVLTPLERDAFKELGRWAYMSKVHAMPGGGSGSGAAFSGELKGTFKIINWQQGIVFFRGIAADTYNGHAAFDGSLARMG